MSDETTKLLTDIRELLALTAVAQGVPRARVNRLLAASDKDASVSVGDVTVRVSFSGTESRRDVTDAVLHSVRDTLLNETRHK